jgi:hypothetical protein
MQTYTDGRECYCTLLSNNRSSFFQYGIAAIALTLCLISSSTPVSVYAGGLSDFIDRPDTTYHLKVSTLDVPVMYHISHVKATVTSMTADTRSKSISIVLNDPSITGGLFVIKLPRNLIDSNSTTTQTTGCSQSANGTVVWSRQDLAYNVTITPMPAGIKPYDYDTTCERDYRILAIPFDAGITHIVIQGTVMVPEFALSGFSIVMFAGFASLLGSIAILRRINHYR